MTINIDSKVLPATLGMVRPLELPATRYSQGHRQMFNVVVTLAQLTQLIVKRPDPNVPIEGNRKVDAKRAQAFGKYIQEKERWVSPAIIVRAPSGDVKFTPAQEFEDGTAWGVLSIPMHLLSDVQVLDGQHRTLGVFNALDEANDRIAKAKEVHADAARLDDAETAARKASQIKELEAKRDRLAHEHISIDLAVVGSPEAKEMFVDINNNAKGVNQDFTTFLDRRDIVNRIAADLMEKHPLLVNRVELGQNARMSAANANLMGAKGVADIVRAVHVGANGRIGSRVEDEMRANERASIQRVERFLDLMVDSFKDIEAVYDGSMTPLEMRAKSMLGSVPMWRVLASVYRDLITKTDVNPEPFTRSEVQAFFESLNDELRQIPVTDPDSFWISTGAFRTGASAPIASVGSMSSLTNALARRARAERPEVEAVAIEDEMADA
jgi:hypothetical protein